VIRNTNDGHFNELFSHRKIIAWFEFVKEVVLMQLTFKMIPKYPVLIGVIQYLELRLNAVPQK
jgi:hypothetical protein